MRECFFCKSALMTGGIREVKVGDFVRYFCPSPRSVMAQNCVNEHLKKTQQSSSFLREQYEKERAVRNSESFLQGHSH